MFFFSFQTAFGIRGLSKKDVVKLKIKKEMFVQSKINVTSMQTNMPTSPSVDSLSVKVVRSHSGPISMQDINSALLNLEQVCMRQLTIYVYLLL